MGNGYEIRHLVYHSAQVNLWTRICVMDRLQPRRPDTEDEFKKWEDSLMVQ